jgi:hypothetical protein
MNDHVFVLDNCIKRYTIKERMTRKSSTLREKGAESGCRSPSEKKMAELPKDRPLVNSVFSFREDYLFG